MTDRRGFLALLALVFGWRRRRPEREVSRSATFALKMAEEPVRMSDVRVRGACWDCGQVPADRTEARATEVGLQCWDCFDRDTAALVDLPWTARLQPGARRPTEADFQRAYEAP